MSYLRPRPSIDVGEQERLALCLVHAADELPAHQRMQLGILVDRPVDREQQAALTQRIEMLVQIAIAARGPCNRARALDVSCFVPGHCRNNLSASPP